MKVSSDLSGYLFTRVLVFLFGCLLLLPAGFKTWNYTLFRHNAHHVSGEVIYQGCGAFIGCRPYISYRDRMGNLHEFKSDINYHWFFAPGEGEEVQILVHRDTPDLVIVDSLLHYISIPLIFIILGVILIFFSFSDRILRSEQV